MNGIQEISLRDFDAGVIARSRSYGPCHAGSIVRDPKTSMGIDDDHAPVSIEPRMKIANGIAGRFVRRRACGDAVRRPFRQHQLHDGFAPSGTGDGGGFIVGVTSAADQRGIAKAAGGLVQSSPSRSCRCNIARAVERDCADRVVGNRGGKQIVFLSRA